LKNNSFFFLIVAAFLFSTMTFAQTVTNVKDKKALLDLGGQSWEAGDKIFGLDAQGKKRALMQIRQVKNGRAIAEIVKGAATPGMTLALARRSDGGSSSSSGGSSAVRGMKSHQAWGLTAALMMNSMKVSNFHSTNFTMSGMNFGGGAFYDYPLTRDWFVRGHATLEMFDVKKTIAAPVCNNSADCNASFMQSGWYGTANYIFSAAPYRFWAGAGGGALIYLSKKSNVVDTSKVFFNTSLMFATGIDIFTSRNTFIPLTFEYQTIPDKQAAVTSMVVRAGWGKTF
jgi:hypothetical protein